MSLKKAISGLRSGSEKEKEAAMKLLWSNKDLQKTAAYYFSKYQKILYPKEWQDLFSEAIITFSKAVEKSQRSISSPKAYFRGICRNLCESDKRKKIKEESALDVLRLLLQKDAKQVNRAKVKAAISQLSQQCQLLLNFYFFENKDDFPSNQQMAIKLKQEGYSIKESSIPATIARCRARFRSLLRNDPSSLFED